MSATVVLWAVTALIGVHGTDKSVSTTQAKYEFTQGFSPMGSCRKMESDFHNGNGEIEKRGNKLISRISSPNGKFITETTTFCSAL